VNRIHHRRSYFLELACGGIHDYLPALRDGRGTLPPVQCRSINRNPGGLSTRPRPSPRKVRWCDILRAGAS
jgi:hypothetical protein